MANPVFLSWGSTPHRTDTVNTLLKRIAGGVLDNGGGGGAAFNNKSGVGSPVGVVTPDYAGQGYTDLTAPYHQWQSNGLTNADWFQIV